MRESDITPLRRLPLLRDIAPAHFNTLVSGAFLQRFPSRIELIRENEAADFLHIIVDGTVELYGALQGRETAIALLEQNATFALAAVVRDEPCLTSARTLTPAKILMIPAGNVRDIFSKDAAFARATVAELAQRYRDVVRDLKGQKLRSGIARLAHYILSVDAQRGREGRVELAIEKRTLASYLGMAPENLSRALSQLAQHGVEVRGQMLTITCFKRLSRLADPEIAETSDA